MAKIIIIGCPGSGKSTLTFKMQEMLKYPVLHLDKIYHINNNEHISREELIDKVNNFALSNNNWIIDGNYISTIEQRIKLADIIILFDFNTKICIENAINRSKKERTVDMADGFDNSKIKDEFLNFITKFKKESLPKILDILSNYGKDKKIIMLKDYQDVDNFLTNLNSLISENKL